MKKSLYAALFCGLVLAIPTASQAQFYSGYTYNNNAYLNYALAPQRANATRHRAKKSKRHHRVRRHHTRR